MAQNFLSCDRDQVMLLPPDLRDWLPDGHLARFVIEVVEQLDLSSVYGCYRSDGHGAAAHDPGMMVALLLYNYAVGQRSSRVIERRCVEDVACRVIAGNRAPDHATIARFRARHQQQLSELFFGVLALCRQAGMVKVGTVAVDSTKLAANASLDASLTEEGLRAEAQRILGEAERIDAAEDELFGDRRGDELPEDLADPRTRAARIRELLELARSRADQLQAVRDQTRVEHADYQAQTGRRRRGAQPGPQLTAIERNKLARTKYNVTDPDSGIVRHRGMLLQGYNIQTAVADGQIILAATPTSASPDHGQLLPVTAKARANLARIGVSEPISELLADTGYWNVEQITQLQAQGVNVMVPPLKGWKAKSPERRQPKAQEMIALLASEEGQHVYQRRQQIIEPVFAHIKHIRGITRLLRRGKTAAQAEIDLIATTHNLLKLYRRPLQAT
jgi:transposase